MKTKNDNRQISKPENIYKEFPGFEIESKFQFLRIPRSSFLDKAKAVLENSQFFVIPGMEKFEWVFHFDYYVYRKNKKLNQAFVIVHHPSTPKFWIRKKSSSEIFSILNYPFQGWVIKRREKEKVEEHPLTTKQVNLVIQKEQKKLGVKPFLLGRLTREKYYTFLKNSKSGRTYSLSLDFCYAFHQKMSQMEIEYKWRDKEFHKGSEEIGGEDIKPILDEFKLLIGFLVSGLSLILIPTKLTKFEWLSRIAYETKKKSKDY